MSEPKSPPKTQTASAPAPSPGSSKKPIPGSSSQEFRQYRVNRNEDPFNPQYLPLLKQELAPDEFARFCAYREQYAAFRRGHARGAKGEPMARPELEMAGEPRSRARRHPACRWSACPRAPLALTPSSVPQITKPPKRRAPRATRSRTRRASTPLRSRRCPCCQHQLQHQLQPQPQPQQQQQQQQQQQHHHLHHQAVVGLFKPPDPTAAKAS